MKLRRITTTGFKTFARRSEVQLEPGLTAVVGPNGSGKSNLVDAVRWALGETNARELRGHRMDEVIYAGGQGRGRMGMAEVELVFDNEDAALPMEDAEVAVSRRVTRGGDSEFRLNGERVRLRDLERLLGTTGLTQTGYAVVAQNDIDGIIQATPSQRRVLVEQAAGVRSLHAASDDAMRRVDMVEGRLGRLHDLLAEAEPRLAELEEQASAARQQLEMSGRLAGLRGTLAREQWRAARAEVRQARHRHTAAGSRAAAAGEAEQGFRERLRQQRDTLERARAARQAAVEALEAARIEAERRAGEVRRWSDRQAQGMVQRSLAVVEHRGAVDRLAQADAEVEAAAAAAALCGTRREVAATARGRLEERRATAAAELEEAEQGLRVAELAVQRAAHDHAAADAAHRDAQARVTLLDEASEAIAAELGATRRRAAELARQAANAGSQLERAARVAADAEAAEAALRTEAADLRTATEHARRTQAEADQADYAVAARVAALRGQLDGTLGASGVATAVAAGRLDARRLVDAVRVRDPADQPAIEAALEGVLQGWIMADLDAALPHLAEGGARCSVLRGGGAPADQAAAPTGARPALAAVSIDPEAEAAVAACLRRTWLCPDLAAARRTLADAEGRAVLPDGTVLERTGVRGGGLPGETLALAAAERLARADAEQARVAAESARVRTHRLAQAFEQAERRAEGAAGATQAARRRQAELEASAAASVTAAGAEERRAISMAAAQRGRADDRGRALAGVGELTGELARTQRVRTEAEAVLASEVMTAGRLRAAMEEVNAQVRAADAEVAGAGGDEAEAIRRQRLMAAAIGEATRRCQIASMRLLATEVDVVSAVVRARAVAAEVAGADVTALADALAAWVAPVQEAEHAVAALEVERAEVAVAAARAADEMAAAGVELALGEARAAELATATLGEDLDDPGDLDPAAAERADREIARLERRVAALGPVNALAPEQHARLATRVLLWRDQRGDLAGACADLRTIAAGLGVEIQYRFDAVFGAVGYHFQEVFSELFPGGRATLRLERGVADVAAGEPEPPGVEILAQPPGKRLQPLTLLSGGERALTALAVIIALQQVNPSPFYLFDEVDAPLDDANVARLVRLLRRLCERQQFLVVTHNHATMAAADALYGVSIDREGVSTVLGVRFTGDRLQPLGAGRVAAAV